MELCLHGHVVRRRSHGVAEGHGDLALGDGLGLGVLGVDAPCFAGPVREASIGPGGQGPKAGTEPEGQGPMAGTGSKVPGPKAGIESELEPELI